MVVRGFASDGVETGFGPDFYAFLIIKLSYLPLNMNALMQVTYFSCNLVNFIAISRIMAQA